MSTARLHVGLVDTRCRESRQAAKTLADAADRPYERVQSRRVVATTDTGDTTPRFEISSYRKPFRLPRFGIVFALPMGVSGEATGTSGNRLVMMRNKMKHKGKRLIVLVGIFCAMALCDEGRNGV